MRRPCARAKRKGRGLAAPALSCRSEEPYSARVRLGRAVDGLLLVLLGRQRLRGALRAFASATPFYLRPVRGGRRAPGGRGVSRLLLVLLGRQRLRVVPSSPSLRRRRFCCCPCSHRVSVGALRHRFTVLCFDLSLRGFPGNVLGRQRVAANVPAMSAINSLFILGSSVVLDCYGLYHGDTNRRGQ